MIMRDSSPLIDQNFAPIGNVVDGVIMAMAMLADTRDTDTGGSVRISVCRANK
jgi:hypothetical protein